MNVTEKDVKMSGCLLCPSVLPSLSSPRYSQETLGGRDLQADYR